MIIVKLSAERIYCMAHCPNYKLYTVMDAYYFGNCVMHHVNENIYFDRLSNTLLSLLECN